MKICKIVNEISNKTIGYLFYYDDSRTYAIEIDEKASKKDLTILIEHFHSRGCLTIDPEWSRRWVESRIVPSDRQNLGMILRDNKIDMYDSYRLLILSDGRCAQDDLAVFRVSKTELPGWVTDRLRRKIDFALPVGENMVVIIYRDGSLWTVDLSEVSAKARVSGISVAPGGNGLYADRGIYIPAEDIYGKGQRLPISKDVLEHLISGYIMDTHEVTEELNCTRQYVGKLVSSGRLHPIKSFGTHVFARSDVMKLKD